MGQNYCLGCSLKKEHAAGAQCSVYGHRHALAVESIVSQSGRKLRSFEGQTLHYLDNDQGASLVKGESLHGKRVEMSGRVFTREHVLEVKRVKAL